MKYMHTNNMDLDDHTSSFDSEDEDLEVRMYSKLYFEPNPDYVPLQSTGHQGGTVRQGKRLKSNSPDGPVDDSRDLPYYNKAAISLTAKNDSSNIYYMTGKQSSASVNDPISKPETPSKQITPKRQGRVRRPSNSSSIPGNMVLDKLYCCSDKPIPEENDDTIDETEVKVTHWIHSNKSLATEAAHCNGKSCAGSQRNQQIKELGDPIVIDDSSDVDHLESDSTLISSNIFEKNANIVQNPIRQNKFKNKTQKGKANDSAVFVHKAPNQNGNKPGTILDVIRLLKNKGNSALKQGKCERPGTRKKVDKKRASQSLTEFTVDLSGESDPEIKEFGNNGILLTNLSMNRCESLRNSAVERVYGITPGEEDDELEPQKKRCKKTRTHWPTDYTADKLLTDRVPPLPHWTPHMTAFYETDFSDEFDMDDIYSRMPSSVIEWDLEEDDLPYSVLRRQQSDRRSTSKQRQRYFRSNARCERCRSFEHSTAACSKLEYCHLCGNTGHSSREGCPFNTCLRCGDGIHTFCEKATLWSKCDLCKQKGHTQGLCPDIWRRFCFTTSGSTPVPPSNTPSPSLPPARLSCFSCGRLGHLGPDCQHRVPNYVVLSYAVMSFDPPTENMLGKTILREVDGPAWDAEEEEPRVLSQYGEDVTVHTPSRASVYLPPGSAGLVIGKGGVVVNTLKRVSGCTLAVQNDNRGQDELWVSGSDIDPVIRAVLFFILRVDTNIDGLDVYASALETATGHGLYDKAYRREMARLRAEYTRQKLKEKIDLQALNKKNAKKLKKTLVEKSKSKKAVHKSNGVELTNGSAVDSTDVVYVSGSDESKDGSDVQIIEKNERLATSNGNLNLSIQSEGKHSFTTPSGKSKGTISKRVADGMKKFAEKQKLMNEVVETESEESSSDTEMDSKSVFIDKILSKKMKYNQRLQEQLTNSENSDGKSNSSDLDSAMEDYADNCFVSSDSDTDLSLEDSDEDSYASDESSDDHEEESGSDTDTENCYNLVLKDKMMDALLHKRRARNKTLIQMLPEGKLSLIATIKGKLAELHDLYVDVKGTLAQLKKDCAEQNRTRSSSSLWSLQEGVKLLATYVLGTKQLGHGRLLVESLMKKLASLESSKDRKIAIEERAAIANILQDIFEVDESNLAAIARYALTLLKRKKKERARSVDQPVLESTPKHPKHRRSRAALKKSHRFSSFREDGTDGSKRKKFKSHSLIDRLSYPSTFDSIDEIDNFNDSKFLRKNIGSFTKTPPSKFNSSRERKSKIKRTSSNGRLEFVNPLGDRIRTPKRGFSKSPKTLRSKSPNRLSSKSPNNSGRPVKRKTSKSPRMKRNQTSDSRTKTRVKGTKGSRTKSKSPRRRK